MDIRALIAAVPFLRRLWRWMPGPLKIVVLVLALVVAVVRMFSGDDEEPEPVGTADEPPGADGT